MLRVKAMEISVVVPTFNRKETVKRCLATVFSQRLPASQLEVIAVVDGSTDGTAAELRRLEPWCDFRVIEQENRGLAGARNTGFRAARSGLVLFLDDDMLCDPHLVARHIQAHKDRDGLVAFGAIFLSEDSPPSLAAECFHRELGAFSLRQKQTPALAWKLTDCVFSNSSIACNLLAEAGGFDENFRMREDLELAVRLASCGVDFHFLADAVAWQYYDKTSSDLIRDAHAFARADAEFARKHPELELEGQVVWLRRQTGWKHRLQRRIARHPAIVDILLAPFCGMAEKGIHIPAVRNAGVRALQIRRRIHWLHTVTALGALKATGSQ